MMKHRDTETRSSVSLCVKDYTLSPLYHLDLRALAHMLFGLMERIAALTGQTRRMRDASDKGER